MTALVDATPSLHRLQLVPTAEGRWRARLWCRDARQAWWELWVPGHDPVDATVRAMAVIGLPADWSLYGQQLGKPPGQCDYALDAAQRERTAHAMCMTWRHDYGLDKSDDNPLSAGMTDAERQALYARMLQLIDHHFPQGPAA